MKKTYLSATVDVQLFDAFYGELFVLQRDLVGVRCEFGCVINDGIWEGSREQDDLDVL
jgi:hypothetical protein